METRQLLVVDAFADEPLAGVPVAVLPDGSGLTETQLRAIAAEVGASAAVTPREGELRHVPRTGHGIPVASGVAVAGLADRADIDPGTRSLAGPNGEWTVELGEDRTVSVTTEQTVERAELDPGEAAEALGLPAAAVTDLGVPVSRADGAGGSILVPVSFMQHLGDLAPDRTDGLLDGAARLVVYTFDTLTAGADLHARVFESGGRERATSGIGAAACAQFLDGEAAFGDQETVRIESGGFVDRPATLDVNAETGAVTGRGLVGVTGDVAVPPDADDDIVTV